MFSLNNIGLHNLKIEGFDPVSFSIMGMLVVFCGLTVISLYILILPKILAFPSWLRTRKAASKTSDYSGQDALSDKEKEVILAISVAFHLDQDFPEEDQKITWKSHGDIGSAWQASGIAHGLAVRNHVHISRRRH